MSGKAKGNQFERDICRKISLWWTQGKHDDWFWRTATSGGRATVRSKAGKDTHGHNGDITATHPQAMILTKLVTMELKCGYSKHLITDLVDRRAGSAQWLEFFKQAIDAANNAKSPYWWLIVHQNRKETMVYMPWVMAQRLHRVCPIAKAPFVQMSIRPVQQPVHVIGFKLDSFFWFVQPENLIIGCEQP